MQAARLNWTRVSQLNGCAFRLDRHARALREHGKGWQRLNNLSTWREVGFHSARERAAPRWAELMTRLADAPLHDARDAAFEALRPHFSEREIVELTWTIARINAWSRMAVGMHRPLEEKALDWKTNPRLEFRIGASAPATISAGPA